MLQLQDTTLQDNYITGQLHYKTTTLQNNYFTRQLHKMTTLPHFINFTWLGSVGQTWHSRAQGHEPWSGYIRVFQTK